jgi:hypothetical protein
MEHAFKVKDVVRWNPEKLTADRPDVRVMFGEGPFTVASVRAVGTSCTCGATGVGKDMPHSKPCGVHIAIKVGHPQFVTLVGINSLFSGAWFLPTQPERKETTT